MQNRLAVLGGALLATLALSSVLPAQSLQGSADAKNHEAVQTTGRTPDLSGFWTPKVDGPDGIRLNSWDPADPYATKPELAPMTPWAIAKWKEVRPPFGAKQTFEQNDPVQKFCDPPGATRLYMYPYEITFLQAPQHVYILYEYSRVWRDVAMDRDHPKDLDNTWLGDSTGKYEGDTFVIDTLGFNDKTWLDQTGHPHSDAMHIIERFRRLDHDTMELSLTVDDPKAYTKTLTGKKIYKLTSSPMAEAICVYSEMQSFQEKVMDPTTKPPSK